MKEKRGEREEERIDYEREGEKRERKNEEEMCVDYNDCLTCTS